MPTCERVLTTETEPERVWTFLSDFTTTEQWDPPTMSTVRHRGDGGVGTVYANVTSVLGRDIEIEYTVIEHVVLSEASPYRLRLRGSSSSMVMEDRVTVQQHGTGAKVTYRADFHAHTGETLDAPLMSWGLRRLGSQGAQQMQQCLHRLG